jgi:hypothetical protein
LIAHGGRLEQLSRRAVVRVLIAGEQIVAQLAQIVHIGQDATAAVLIRDVNVWDIDETLIVIAQVVFGSIGHDLIAHVQIGLVHVELAK